MINQNAINKIREYIQISNIDGVYITNTFNLKYIIGQDIADRIYITLQKIYIMVGSIYINEAKDLINSNDVSIINISDKKSKEDIKAILENKNIGIEAKDLTVLHERKLIDEYGVSKMEDIKGLIDNIRVIKTQEEIESIKIASKITANAFNHILQYVKVGMTEKQIRNELNKYMLDNGADDMAFDTIVASGENSSNPHASVSQRKIQENDIILFDFGAKYKGLCSDMSRTIFVGKPSEEMIQRYTIVLNAQKLGIENIKVDGKIGQIHEDIEKYFKEFNVNDKFIHTTGHGVGLEIHESPVIYTSNKEDVFCENMIVTVEPGIYFENEYGIRIEDTVLVTKEGTEILTVCNKELIII